MSPSSPSSQPGYEGDLAHVTGVSLHFSDKGKNWRHVFKSLTLLDYLLHAGSENVVKYFKCVSCEVASNTKLKGTDLGRTCMW